MRSWFAACIPAAVTFGLIAAASGGVPDAWKMPARYELEYRVHLADLTAAGAKARLWVPYPADSRDQRILVVHMESPWPWTLQTEKKFGNRMVYNEGIVGSGLADFVMRFQVERKPSIGVPLGTEPLLGGLSPALYRAPDRLVPLTGTIEQIARQESKGLSTEEEKIRAFYDYVYRTMTYNKDGTGWGRGDALWACTNKRGNCTDFHSLFIGMLRSQGIPARFLIGFPIPDGGEGAIPGYHCWAEFYDAKRGWLPVDASEAKKKGLQDAYFGSLPNDRVEFTTGRDIVLEPPQAGEPLNYFVYPYVEIDGRPAPSPKSEIHFKRLEESSS